MTISELLISLPGHLHERSRTESVPATVVVDPARAFVLYWMRTAVRSEENPALDVAKWFADQLGVRLLVYQAVSEHYEFASDRHHTFMLQGARDVQREFAEAGVSYAFHLATSEDRRPHLTELATMATVVVTEDMPVGPPRRFVKALTGSLDTPVVCVDTACVAPMRLVQKCYTRAFEFRRATKKIYAERLTRVWPVLELECSAFDLGQLPFAPLDLQTANFAELVSRCKIDHAVGPVVDTVGGSVAGYVRWNEFKLKKLTRYANQRNDSLLDGVSRMSAYLHYGMVSPLRLAREAADVGNAGAEKYLDELLIWRELAYAFCFYREDYDQWSAIPDWARETLIRREGDERPEIYSDEQLERAQTSDCFWNAAQQSLLVNGELHNNVRMTWGKAILNWKQSPQVALRTIIDLNHRYALDGRDPASYGGILWCVGQFDRPFEPERNVFGSVRPRTTAQHASRLDTQAYQAKVGRARFKPLRVAVVGAGVSGLFAARTLQDHGVEVLVFDKGRSVGGRMSTRRIGDAAEGTTFDHGAQYFTARDSRFQRYVQSWLEQGIVAKWPDANLGSDQKLVVLEGGVIQSESRSDDRFVGVPGMNAICKHLASGVDVRIETQITKVGSTESGVELFGGAGESLGCFDRMVVAVPAVQAAGLLTGFSGLAAEVAAVQMNPCWATMVALESPVTFDWAGAFLHGSFLSWAARNNTKPGRNRGAEHLVIHANPEWTASHWEVDRDEVAELMLAEFWRVSGASEVQIVHVDAHRWKYAIPVDPAGERVFASECSTVVACGDWANGSRVEGAFLSGMSAAGCILRQLVCRGDLSPKQSTLF